MKQKMLRTKENQYIDIIIITMIDLIDLIIYFFNCIDLYRAIPVCHHREYCCINNKYRKRSECIVCIYIYIFY